MSDVEVFPEDSIPIWLDCDPGHDDAFAILLACYSPKIKLLGISIVHGNDTAEHCALNALRILWACGIDEVPVYKGIQRPITREPKFCPEIHGIPGKEGVAGMCGYHFPDEEIFQVPGSKYKVEDTHGVIAMANSILKHPRKVSVVLTGAQTNFAVALRMFPEIKGNIDKVVFMGGAIGLGNTGVAAEFNIQIDPEAAAVVLHSGIPLVMIPLEVTHQVLVTTEVLSKLANIDLEAFTPRPVEPSQLSTGYRPNTDLETSNIVNRVNRVDSAVTSDEPISSLPNFSSKFAECCYQLLTFFKGTYCKEFGFPHPPLHDPCTIFYLTHPDCFGAVELHVDVETSSEKCAGRTLCDFNNLNKKQRNVLVCTSIDVNRFWTHFLTKVQLASQRSPLNKK